MPGTNSSQIPDAPIARIGCRRPSQPLKSPTTLTERAAGAQTANDVPTNALDLANVRAQRLVQLLVTTLPRKMQVELADRGLEAIRVLDRIGLAARVVDLQLVLQGQLAALDLALEQARRMRLLELDLRASGMHDNALGRRPERAHDNAAVAVGMRAEERVRLGVVAGDQALDVGAHASAISSSRAIAATGICTQSGRLFSS